MVITIKDLSFRYRKGRDYALKNLSLNIKKGKFVIDIHDGWSDFIALLVLILLLGIAIILHLNRFGMLEVI